MLVFATPAMAQQLHPGEATPARSQSPAQDDVSQSASHPASPTKKAKERVAADAPPTRAERIGWQLLGVHLAVVAHGAVTLGASYGAAAYNCHAEQDAFLCGPVAGIPAASTLGSVGGSFATATGASLAGGLAGGHGTYGGSLIGAFVGNAVASGALASMAALPTDPAYFGLTVPVAYLAVVGGPIIGYELSADGSASQRQVARHQRDSVRWVPTVRVNREGRGGTVGIAGTF